MEQILKAFIGLSLGMQAKPYRSPRQSYRVLLFGWSLKVIIYMLGSKESCRTQYCWGDQFFFNIYEFSLYVSVPQSNI